MRAQARAEVGKRLSKTDKVADGGGTTFLTFEARFSSVDGFSLSFLCREKSSGEECSGKVMSGKEDTMEGTSSQR